MLKQIIKFKKRKTTFICQLADSYLKVIKCQISKKLKREFIDLGLEAITADIDDKKLSEKLEQVFKKLGYKNELVIISLARNHATCRYLKVPTQAPEEIERIISLQAPRYLPYPANELITGYQVISVDKEGYTELNLIIVHKDIIQRYIKIFQGLNIKNFKLYLNSYGLFNLYSYIQPEELKTVMLIDIDAEQVELAIASYHKLLFSRYFKFNRTQANWENMFIDEINKTQDAYIKELSKEIPVKIILLAADKISQGLIDILKRHMALPVELLFYVKKVNISSNLSNALLNSNNSFASLIGLGLRDIEESLNLLPQDMKETIKEFAQRKGRLRLILFIVSIILLWGLGIVKNLDNKTNYLNQLKLELNKISKDARPLEDMEKKIKLLESRSEKSSLTLDILYELSQAQPAQISLTNFSYEENNQIILRGQTPELNSIFLFVSQLEKSAVFKNFNIKVRYATKKKTQTAELVDFEIVCLKK